MIKVVASSWPNNIARQKSTCFFERAQYPETGHLGETMVSRSSVEAGLADMLSRMQKGGSKSSQTLTTGLWNLGCITAKMEKLSERDDLWLRRATPS